MSEAEIKFQGFEVIQSIQNDSIDPKQRVSLIAGKRGYVRAYLESSLPTELRMTGSLRWSVKTTASDGTQSERSGTIASTDRVTLDAKDKKLANKTTKASNRLVWSKSLNFALDRPFWYQVCGEEWTKEKDTDERWLELVDKQLGRGFEIDFSLESLIRGEDPKLPYAIGNPDDAKTTEHFKPAVCLFVKAVGLRVQSKNLRDVYEPKTQEIELVRDCLSAILPVAHVHWRRVTIDAGDLLEPTQVYHYYTGSSHEAIENQLSDLMSRLLALRNEDLLAGQDPRTLYIGILPDPAGQYGGIAMDVPDGLSPHVVSIAAVEPTGELAAHEICHALGRLHPGIPDVRIFGRPFGQLNDYKKDKGIRGFDRDGRISCDAKVDHSDTEVAAPENLLGLDTRRAQSPELLNGRDYFDIMTYRQPKWVSRVVYEDLYTRIRRIYSARRSLRTEEPAWTVIGRYDLRNRTGTIEHVLRTNYATPEDDVGGNDDDDERQSITLVWGESDADRRNIKLTSQQATIGKEFDPGIGSFAPNPESSCLCKDLGLIQQTVPAAAEPTTVSLLINDLATSAFANVKAPKDALARSDPGSVNPAVAFTRIAKAINTSLGIEESLGADARIDPEPSNDTQSRAPEVENGDAARQQDGNNNGVRDGEGIRFALNDNEPRLLSHGVRLTWSGSHGEYYFHYFWPDFEQRVSTTIQCRRPAANADGDLDDGPEWETIHVSNDLTGRVWISPVFFGRPPHDGSTYSSESCVSHTTRATTGVAIRVCLNIGFAHACVLQFGKDGPNDDPFLRTNEFAGADSAVEFIRSNGKMLPKINDIQEWLRFKEEFPNRRIGDT